MMTLGRQQRQKHTLNWMRVMISGTWKELCEALQDRCRGASLERQRLQVGGQWEIN